MADQSELQVAFAEFRSDADALAAFLDPEIAPNATAETVAWKDGQAVACMSERDVLVIYAVSEGFEVERVFIGHLPGAVVSDKRYVAGDSLQGQVLNTKELRIEHPESERLAKPLVFDVSQRREERVDKIRNALLSLARST